jgi:glycosyltransferase involved in cell wall biosynthesis
MRILFLDQSGSLGGAELCLLDIAQSHQDRCLVALFESGSFQQELEKRQIPVQVLSHQSCEIRKNSTVRQSLIGAGKLIPLMIQVARLSRSFDVIYANTQKALVVGAIASLLSQRPLVYHLHDIISTDHFSSSNQRVIVTLANQVAALVITNSKASREAFIKAGGKAEKTHVVYNGFNPRQYPIIATQNCLQRKQLNLDGQFVVGCFSRLSPWKGQHILIKALSHCMERVSVVLVGDALFGEQQYVQQLHQQIADLGLEHRVHFLGFRSDIPSLMAACDLIAHTSVLPEPFGRVIVEAMLCQRPVVATASGGVMELVHHGMTGWLVPPDDPFKLADVIDECCAHPERAAAIALRARNEAVKRFDLNVTNHRINQLLAQL